ncbi:hypothetical protein [Mesorhizobium sp. f-mel]
MTWLETNLQQSADSSGMIWIQATRRVDRTKTAGTNEDEHAIERDLLALQDKHSRSHDWRRRHLRRQPDDEGAGMTSSEVSTLHAALFFATVWIVSSLRINRLKALWRVGFGLKKMRGPSGNLQPRGPKARAATGGSAGGAGASGVSLKT